MFLGVMVLPSLFGVVIAAGGGYPLAYAGAAALAVAGPWRSRGPWPRPAGRPAPAGRPRDRGRPPTAAPP